MPVGPAYTTQHLTVVEKIAPWQDDNARRRPRALCALSAITKLEAGNGPVFEGAGLEGSHGWLEPCGNARLERQ
jgi:hypothetical protein